MSIDEVKLKIIALTEEIEYNLYEINNSRFIMELIKDLKFYIQILLERIE